MAKASPTADITSSEHQSNEAEFVPNSSPSWKDRVYELVDMINSGNAMCARINGKFILDRDRVLNFLTPSRVAPTIAAQGSIESSAPLDVAPCATGAVAKGEDDVIADYSHLPPIVRRHISDLEDHIANIDGLDTNDGVIDAREAAQALNGIIRFLKPCATGDSGKSEALAAAIEDLHSDFHDEQKSLDYVFGHADAIDKAAKVVRSSRVAPTIAAQGVPATSGNAETEGK